jgi:hypothetical protein
MGLPQDWGYGRQEGISRLYGLTRSGRVSWILRLVKTGDEGQLLLAGELCAAWQSNSLAE